jgi:hypothetical protein
MKLRGLPARPCASSSLVWFVGGLAARVGGAVTDASMTGVAADTAAAIITPAEGEMHVQSEAGIQAALEEARSTIEGLVVAVGGQGAGGGQQQQQQGGKGGQVTMRGPHLAKVGALPACMG